ncbi:MAG: prephenate dehydrogenase/arogenate dehydrogenase family protein [Nitriliruptorales bacterium]|nr:prephenate dehydrogenase/arogenate dehydrogenase family protein [Nitriliruptorales bacterium]
MMELEATPLRIAIVGTGLVGASLGLALRAVDEVDEVVGWDVDDAQLRIAVERGAVTTASASAPEAAADADVVFLAVPVSVVADAAAQVGPVMKAGAILTDVASVKASVVDALQQAVAAGVHVVGGHPMAGSHEAGAAHASGELFVGASYLLTPTTTTDPSAYQRLHSLIAKIGARPLAVDPAHHDALVAVISHLPQLAATTLMNLAADRAREEHAGLLLLAAGGFRDATRVAASDPALWVDICTQNREAIVAVLDEYRERIGALRSVVEVRDEVSLRQVLGDARAARRALPGKETVTGALVELHIPIPDRPGVLAEVTTTVGAAGVNIEDLGIDHAPEGGRGVLRLAITGFKPAGTAREALESVGYEVLERPL